ncbi:bifunctional pyr operon transcriptional regulator/uracil phosphoribosyltransferase PyrR [Mangrovivirga sp. M17]|uniref:Bifunctional pyr operon transcriptional regulator/uracil phosphoribosyltransferase PyrR n=1 Tax=Mangrovivirga halotolerans TaxID=2993936 RepID=A0ABT3RTG9_9BACT|nr:bifunctional pyr operon transcriptional regulator/uracil phosphoribosyltransferase PyrR [Mangrovivirga halotolerans]MCX2745088.1 bifunctional pyr operon transcriptional regulator/uracil phosphoribosyltransferase PyrR [Mangrovivirga halotolerans]
MQKRNLLHHELLEITILRLCQQLIENHGDFENSVILGLQPRGSHLARIVQQKLKGLTNIDVPLGYLDTTFHRDDFRRRDTPITANQTDIPFLLEDKKVILIDDVLFTGRSVRAAMDAMIAFGRPLTVELLVLVNRRYSRDLPIEPKYTGRNVNTIKSQKVLVEWKDQGANENSVWLIDN